MNNDKYLFLEPPLWIPYGNFCEEKDLFFYGEYDRKMYCYVRCLLSKGVKIDMVMANRIWRENVIEKLIKEFSNFKIVDDDLLNEGYDFPEFVGSGNNLILWDVEIVFPLSLYLKKLGSICDINMLSENQVYRLSSLLFLKDNPDYKINIIYPLLWMDNYGIKCLKKIMSI